MYILKKINVNQRSTPRTLFHPPIPLWHRLRRRRRRRRSHHCRLRHCPRHSCYHPRRCNVLIKRTRLYFIKLLPPAILSIDSQATSRDVCERTTKEDCLLKKDCRLNIYM